MRTKPTAPPKLLSQHRKKTGIEPASGTAAEYFVAGELLRRGVNAFLSVGAHKQIDVLVRTADGAVTIVDVKAVHGPKPRRDLKKQASWNMSKVGLHGSTQRFFYVLVWLGSKHGDYAQPEYFVVPAAWAAKECDEKHTTWAAAKATRKAESTMRRLDYADVTEWRDRWDLLGAHRAGESQDPRRSAAVAMMGAMGRDELLLLDIVLKAGGKWAVFKEVTVLEKRGRVRSSSEQVSPDYNSEADAKKHAKLISFG